MKYTEFKELDDLEYSYKLVVTELFFIHRTYLKSKNGSWYEYKEDGIKILGTYSNLDGYDLDILLRKALFDKRQQSLVLSKLKN